MSENANKIDLVRLGLRMGLAWVLFDNGTFIVFPDAAPDDNIAESALAIMKQHAKVFGAIEPADFEVTTLANASGWVARGDVPDMYVLVDPEELDSDSPTELEIGEFAHVIRQLDSEDLDVLHVNRARRTSTYILNVERVASEHSVMRLLVTLDDEPYTRGEAVSDVGGNPS